MSSLGNQSPENRGLAWPAAVRTLLVQAFVLLALSGVCISYLRWSSDANWAAFTNAGEPPVPGAKFPALSSAPVQTAKGQAACHRKG